MFTCSGHRLTTFALGMWLQIVCCPAQAQQANQPGYDPRQTERRFEDQQIGPVVRRTAPVADAAIRADGRAGRFQAAFRAADTSPSPAPSRYRTADWLRPINPIIGKKVSQADLAAIAAAVGDIYREAGFHLSRAIDSAAGHPERPASHLQVIEGSITEVALKGDGRRAVRHPAAARRRVWPSGLRGFRRWSGNCS